MAKDGSSKAKSADDHAAARKAAQLRKKRGHAHHGPKDPAKIPVSLVDIQRERLKRENFVRAVDANVTRQVDHFSKQIEAGGSVVYKSALDAKLIIRALKDKYRSNTDVVWDDQETCVVFGKRKKNEQPKRETNLAK